MVKSSTFGTFENGETDCHYYQFTYMHLITLQSKVPTTFLTVVRLKVIITSVHAFSRTVVESSKCGTIDHCTTD